jgi:hypothetical protein
VDDLDLVHFVGARLGVIAPKSTELVQSEVAANLRRMLGGVL